MGAAVIGAAAESDGGVVGAGDRALERCSPVGTHDTTDVGRPGRLQRGEGVGRVVGVELGVCVHSNDDGIGRRTNREVEADRDVGGRILDETDAWVGCRKLVRQLVRAIGRWA